MECAEVQLMTTTKANREKEIFELFAVASTLAIDTSSIENRKPPEPDIRCRLDNGETVAFELTELIDEQHMERLAKTANTKDALYNHYENYLSSDQRKLFDLLYNHAFLHFDFSIDSKLKERRNKFNFIFDLLLSCPEPLSEFEIRHCPKLMPILDTIRVSKSRINGPLFDVGNFGRLGDPTKPAILKKLYKKYECNYPIELVAYINWQLLPPEEVWKHAVNSAAKNLSSSQFRKIWVYDLVNDKIEFIHPE